MLLALADGSTKVTTPTTSVRARTPTASLLFLLVLARPCSPALICRLGAEPALLACHRRRRILSPTRQHVQCSPTDTASPATPGRDIALDPLGHCKQTTQASATLALHDALPARRAHRQPANPAIHRPFAVVELPDFLSSAT